MPKYISSWSMMVEDWKYSPRQFLEATEQTIALRRVPNVTLRRVWHGGGTLGRREYLRVIHRQTYMDIGCMPYGDAFSVSWVHESDRVNDRAVKNINIIKKITGLFPGIAEHSDPILDKQQKWLAKDRRSRFHQDDETMFQKLVHQCVVDTIDQLGNVRGSRLNRPRY